MPIAKIFSVRKLSNLKERRFLFGRLDAIIFKAIILSARGIVFYACALVYTKINQFTNDGNGDVEAMGDNRCRVLIIDGQGGRIGKQLAEAIGQDPRIELTAAGTNSAATVNMMKGGVRPAATGENAVVVGCRRADIIAGPIGIVIADALMGEVTPRMAAAVGQSLAKKILIPVNKCDNIVIGTGGRPVAELIEEAVALILKAVNSGAY